MSIFEVQTIDRAPEASRAPLEKLQQAFGMVPNVAGIIANSPVLAKIFVPLFEGVHAGTFTEAEIQTLLLTNAVTNSCAWAVAFHSYLALKAGLNPADVEAIREHRAPREPRYRGPLGLRPRPDRKARPRWRRGSGGLSGRRLQTGPGAGGAGGKRRIHDHQLHAEHRRAAARADVPGAGVAALRSPRYSLSRQDEDVMIPENVHLNIGSLLFEDLDQIDLTGPFEVLSRLPNSTHRIYAKTMGPGARHDGAAHRAGRNACGGAATRHPARSWRARPAGSDGG